MNSLKAMELSHSILNSLTPDDVRELIAQESLIVKGNLKIHYAVDHYEVSEYCFPLGFTESDQAIDLDEMADRQAALSHLFRHHRVLFFEEYDRELDRLYEFINATIDKQLQNDIRLLLYQLALTQQEGYLPNQNDKNRQVYLRQIISERLPLILAICLGFANDGIKKLRQLDSEKLLFDHNDVIRSNYWTSIIAQGINQSKSKILAVQLLRELQGEKPESLQNRLMDSPSLRDFVSRSRRNTETDCKVIARILQLNKFLYECYKNKLTKEWHFFQLISSTALFGRLTKLDSFRRQLFEEQGIRLIPYRTLAQRYLWMLCEGDNRQRELENFKQYLEFEQQKETLQGTFFGDLKTNSSSLTSDFIERIQTVRNNYEYTGLFANYLASQSINKDSKENLTPVRKLLNRFNSVKNSSSHGLNDDKRKYNNDQYLWETQALYEEMLLVIDREGPTNIAKLKTDKLWLSNELRQESSYQNRLLNGLNNLQKKLDNEENQFYVLRGNDPVQGSFQHLPIAFFVSEQHRDILYRAINNFLRLTLDRAQLKAIFNDLLKLTVDEDITYTSSDAIISYTPKYEEKLIRFVLIMLVPRQTLQERPDEDLYIWVTEVINRLESDISHPEIDKFHYVEVLKKMQIEYYYVAAWLARRLEYYDRSKFYTDKGRKVAPNDVRFIHADCLLVYCYALKAINSSKTNSKIQIIAWLNECYTLSERALSLLVSPTTDFTVGVNKYLKVSLQNTSAYVKALLAQYDSLQASLHIEDGKRRLNEVQQFDDNYSFYPEFLHTEAVLLYMMLSTPNVILEKSNRVSTKEKGIKSIKSAMRLKKNIEIDNRPDDYSDWLKKLEEIN